MGVGFWGVVTHECGRVWMGVCACVLKREDVAGLERAGGRAIVEWACAESRSAEWDIVLRMCLWWILYEKANDFRRPP